MSTVPELPCRRIELAQYPGYGAATPVQPAIIVPMITIEDMTAEEKVLGNIGWRYD